MADSGGHWKTLAEAQKLTQSTKVPGVFEEDIKRNNLLERMPVAQAAGTGRKIEWLRESGTMEDAVVETGIGNQLLWGEDMEYTEVESILRTLYVQRKLDHYVEGIYGTYNNYQAQMLIEAEKGLKRRVGDRLIYADTDYGGSPIQFDGLHALVAERGSPWTTANDTNNKLNMDMASGALSLHYLRNLLDAMKLGADEILVPPCIGMRLDEAYEERGFTGDIGDAGSINRGIRSYLTKGLNDMGKPVLYFGGVPIVRTDYLLTEEDGTGTGSTSNKRQKYSSTAAYSIFVVKYGNLMERDPGICYGFGATEGQGDFYKMRMWDDLEDFDAAGIRLINYGTVLLGSTLCLGRIFDITDSEIVV